MTQQNQDPGHLYWVDLIRAITIFLVIIIHVSADLLYAWDEIPLSNWMAGNIYDSLARVSVPLLFMISGSLLLGKDEPIQDFFRKRAARILIPFAAWSLIYLFWRCNVINEDCSTGLILRLLLLDGTSYHLWFLYALMGVYLITPLLRVLTAASNKSTLWYFILLWMLFEPGLTLLDKLWKLQIGISVPMATGYIGLFILGYLLNDLTLSRRNVMWAFIIWLVNVLVTASGTYIASLRAGQFSGFLYEYLSFNVILASVSAFILLKSLSEQRIANQPFLACLISRIASGSLGIYLIHVLIIDIIGNRLPWIQLDPAMGNPIWSIPLVSMVVLVLSYCVIYIVQKIPIINRIIT